MNTRNLKLFRHDEALVSWDHHADALGTILRLVQAVQGDSPCTCDGICPHCTRLAWLEVETKTALSEATEECNTLAVCGCVCPGMFGPNTAA